MTLLLYSSNCSYQKGKKHQLLMGVCETSLPAGCQTRYSEVSTIYFLLSESLTGGKSQLSLWGKGKEQTNTILEILIQPSMDLSMATIKLTLCGRGRGNCPEESSLSSLRCLTASGVIVVRVTSAWGSVTMLRRGKRGATTPRQSTGLG